VELLALFFWKSWATFSSAFLNITDLFKLTLEGKKINKMNKIKVVKIEKWLLSHVLRLRNTLLMNLKQLMVEELIPLYSLHRIHG
jgi:hypothetical protein